MIDTKDILKMATHVFKRGQGFYDKRTMHPSREWLLGLLIFVALIIAGGVQSVYTFMEYQHMSTDGGTFREEMVQFNPSLSEKAIGIYNKRKEIFTKLQTGTPAQKPIETQTATSSPTSVNPAVETTATTTIGGGAELAN